jgi:hypothetical protein
MAVAHPRSVTITRHGSATIEFPSDREALVTRRFDASAELLFDVLTNPEHLRVWFTDGDEDLEVCEIDPRVGGCSFHGTYLEVERPVRTVAAEDGVRAADGMQGSCNNLEDHLATLT